MPREASFSIGNPDARLRILWLHGYTGAPGAFRTTVEHIAETCDAFVHAPLLPGHGTSKEDLCGVDFETLLQAARSAAKETVRADASFVIVGYSFGGYLAAVLANEFDVSALILALTPFSIRFPASLPGAGWIMSRRTFWNKYLTAEDVAERKGTFYYPDVPGTSLSFIKQGNALLRNIVPDLSCPIYTIHNESDPVAKPDSGERLIALHPHPGICEPRVLPGGRHALFFRPEHDLELDLLQTLLRRI